MANTGAPKTPIPPEKVREIADKVYKLWRKEMQLLLERKRAHGKTRRRR